MNHVRQTALVAFALTIGFGLGWGLKPERERVVEVRATKSEREMKSATSKSQARQTAWVARLKTDSPEEVAREVDTGDMEAVLVMLMEGMWGDLTWQETKRLQGLIAEWTSRDPDGCLAWARSLKQPNQRSLALMAISGEMMEGDLAGAFEIFSEAGEVDGDLASRMGMGTLVKQHLANAALDGPEKLIEEYKKIPLGKGGTYGNSINFPEGFDFPGLLRGLAAYKSENSVKANWTGSRPVFNFAELLGQWARVDLDSAMSFSLEPENISEDVRWIEFAEGWRAARMGYDVSDLRRTLAQRLNEVPFDDFKSLVENGNIQGRATKTPIYALLENLDADRAAYLSERLASWENGGQ